MEQVYIIGSAMNRFGRYLDGSVKAMAAEVVNLALEDAGIEPSDLEYAAVSNTLWGMYTGQHSIRGQVALRPLGIGGIPVVNTENACAGASTAFYLACREVQSGACDVALALGVEKISHQDKNFAFQAYYCAQDVENAQANLERLKRMSQKPGDQAPREGSGRSVFMDIYAAMARYHMQKYGTTQRQLAVISAKNHFHGSMNPLAQIQRHMTEEEVLQDPLIAYPLTRAMCAPVGDGAAASILCSERFLRQVGDRRAVRVLAAILGSGRDRTAEEEAIGSVVARKAYNLAGVDPKEINIAELHDATAFGELAESEAMGFCKPGEGGLLAESGATRLGGRIPINTSGGLESRGHPIGASGLAMIHEVVTQLRSEAGARQVPGARLGLVENGGGFLGIEEAAICVTILGKP